jgi:hypothetical protein
MNEISEQPQATEVYEPSLGLTEGNKPVSVGIREIQEMDKEMKEQFPELYTKIQKYVEEQFPEGATLTIPMKRYVSADTMYVEDGLSIFATKITKDQTGKEALFSTTVGKRELGEIGVSEKEMQKLYERANQSRYVDKQE